jgi:hypothetical protein
MRILVVEDDRKHREDLKNSLGHARGPCPMCILPVTFEVETAESVEQARKQLVERGYDFVLLDLEMSGELEAQMLLPLLEELLVPYAFYAEDPGKVKATSAPIWEKQNHIRMDLVTKISDYYHAFVKARQKELTKSGRFCMHKV